MRTTWLGKCNPVHARCKRSAESYVSSAWYGARIILRQVSPESSVIFDFIIELHRTCAGNWDSLTGPDISSEDLRSFLTYAATFLSNIGNYYVRHARSYTSLEAVLIPEGFWRSKVYPQR